jgi:hypothetical protein
VPEIGKAGPGHEPNITSADHRYSHESTSTELQA